jgi:hypothetical protein
MLKIPTESSPLAHNVVSPLLHGGVDPLIHREVGLVEHRVALITETLWRIGLVVHKGVGSLVPTGTGPHLLAPS